jgi:ABC-2 type transport system ATP-binding protein
MGLEWPLTAAENVRFFAELCGMDPPLARARTDEALRGVGLWADRDKYPSKLSNGMRQRVILARALLFRTPLVLLDEPTVGLDPLTVRDMLALFRRLCAERGQTLLLTDHQAAEIEALASHIAILADGAISLSGTPAELRAQLRDVTVIEVHTEEMDPPAAEPPESALAIESIERPGPLESRVWRVHAWASPRALEDALDWITQPRGRVTLVAEREPALSDVLALDRAQIEARRAPLAAGSQAERAAREGAPD